MADYSELEALVTELLDTFEVSNPPIPIETMLQKPPQGMWEELDVTQLSGSFLKINDTYAPRMSMARLLARHIARSEWGKAHGLQGMDGREDEIRVFARMLIMPRTMIENLSAAARVPSTMRLQFEVPEEDAQQRLQDIKQY